MRERFSKLRPANLWNRHSVPRDFLKTPKVEKLASGFRFVEGPIWIAEENCLLLSDIPGNCIYKLDAKRRVEIFIKPSDNANGLTRNAQGRLLICQHKARRVGILSRDGKMETLVDSYHGRKLNSPNDVVVKSDGAVYFTDPFSGADSSLREQPVEGVYRLAAGVLTLLADDFARPNGLAFSPDESKLYIGDSSPRSHIRVFDVGQNGELSNGRVFCAAEGGIWVFDESGEKLGIIRIPEQPSNCNWGGEDGSTLFVTARTSIYRVRLNIGKPIIQPVV